MLVKGCANMRDGSALINFLGSMGFSKVEETLRLAQEQRRIKMKLDEIADELIQLGITLPEKEEDVASLLNQRFRKQVRGILGQFKMTYRRGIEIEDRLIELGLPIQPTEERELWPGINFEVTPPRTLERGE